MSNGKSSIDPSNQAHVRLGNGLQSLDLKRIVKLRLINKLSYREIAAQLNCSPQAVSQRVGSLAALLKSPEILESYQDNKANLLESAQVELVTNMLDSDKLKKASVNNLAYAAQSLDNMIRLQRGETTSNIGFADYSKALEQVIKDRAKLEEELGINNVSEDISE